MYSDRDDSNLNHNDSEESDEEDEYTDSDHSQGIGKPVLFLEDIPWMLKEFNEISVQALKNNDETEQALDHLKRCE